MTTRQKIIRVLVALFFLVLPQLLIWLNKNGNVALVTTLCLLYAIILSLALLKFLAAIIIYSPEGLALYAKIKNAKSFLFVVIGAFHIVYALYRVGWGGVAILLLIFMGLAQILLFIGRTRLARLDDESLEKLWSFIQERIRQVEQDGDGQARSRSESIDFPH